MPAAVLLPLLLSTAPAAAQRPAELAGRVTEVATGAPVAGAVVELVEAGRQVLTDVAGRYGFRAVEPGLYRVRVTRLGYAPLAAEVRLENGRTRRLDLRLDAAPVELAALYVAARPGAGATRVDRTAIERAGARTAGDAVGALPGVLVRSNGPGGPQTVSIRGSAEHAVLVLVDGVALNDPVTGEADLSTVSAAAIESITVLPGAQSARHGPRAEAGVILIETRHSAADRMVSAGAGSLAARSAAAEWGGTGGLAWGGTGGLAWGVGAAWRAVGGEFEFELPPEAGSGRRRRTNADVEAMDAWAAASGTLLGGRLQARAGVETMERGLPGPGYAPSRSARQALDRSRASVAWRRTGAGGALAVSLAGVDQAVRYRDPAPPFGPRYDDTATVRSLELRTEFERVHPGSRAVAWGAGLETRWQRIETGLLAADVPADRLDLGVFAHGAASTRLGGAGTRLGAATLDAGVQLRADRDPLHDAWTLSRALMLRLGAGPVDAHVAARSSYSPPTLGDQFFRDAVGVEPNPELRAERVPSELELGVTWRGAAGGITGEIGLVAYRGDVRDMIVWAPDYRFVWSPRNFDVKRRGAELRAALESPDRRLRLTLSHAYNRVTYDRGAGDDTVQVIYRVPHTAAATLRWNGNVVELDLEARYIGERYPVPARVNALPGFWTLSGGAARSWPIGSLRLTTALRAERLLDERAALIFGFPEPGRVLRLDVRLTPDRLRTLDS